MKRKLTSSVKLGTHDSSSLSFNVDDYNKFMLPKNITPLMKEAASNKIAPHLGIGMIDIDQTSLTLGTMLEMCSTIGSLSLRLRLAKQQPFKQLNSFNNPSII